MSAPRFKLAFLATLACSLAAPAMAQSVRVLGEHNAWSAYATGDGSSQICFSLTRPTSTEPQPAGLGDAYFYVTHRPGETIRNEINLVAGYEFAAESEATLSVSGQNFTLFTQDDAAWLADPAQATAATSAIRAGSTMTVEGRAASGGTVTQTFSLSGATAASGDIDGAC